MKYAALNRLLYLVLHVSSAMGFFNGVWRNGVFLMNGAPTGNEKVDISINLQKSSKIVDKNFVSVALDSSLVAEHWPSFDFRSVRLHTLAKALHPGYLRFGGTASDFLVFQPKAVVVDDVNTASSLFEADYDVDVNRKNYTEFFMTAADFDNINNFAVSVGWRLVFDLDVLLRDSHNRWNSSNALDLLSYAVEQHYDSNMDLELGNEPNAFSYAFHRNVTPEMLAEDFRSLRTMLNGPQFVGRFPKSILIGPSVSQPKRKTLDYLSRFLSTVDHSIDAISVHHYYIDGRTAELEDMMSSSVLNTLADKLIALRHTVSDAGYGKTPIWLGETSSCWGGGAPGLSDRYVAGFMWLDKLGLAATLGVNVVVRQSFFHSHYALVNKFLDPNPDFWLTWLYKKLVGREVLQTNTSHPENVRFYAHCSRPSSSSSHMNGSVTVYGLNLHDKKVTVTFDNDMSKCDKHVYWLQPSEPNHLTSGSVSVSGKILELVDDETLPSVVPTVVPGGHDVVIPAKSFGFIVIPDAHAHACLSNST